MKMKKFTATLLAVALTVTSLPSVTAEGYISAADVMKAAGAVAEVNAGEESPAEDFEYEVNGDGGITITGYKGDGGDVVIPSAIDGKKVTEIGMDAFYKCTSLTSVKIPDSVTAIRSSAFRGCTSLTSMKIPDSVTKIGTLVFSSCTSLTSVEIPNGVTEIGYCTFEGCISLTSVEIPNSVTVIGNSAFSGCSSIASVEIPNSVTKIESRAFQGCTSLTSMEIPNSVTVIGDGAFTSCTSLTSVEIPDSVTVIERGTFYSCTSLTSVEIPDSVTEIKAQAFEECRALSSVKLPNSITSIAYETFSGCRSLTAMEIPHSVRSIGDSAFAGCSSLKSIDVDENNAHYSSADGVLFNKDKTTLMQYPAGKTNTSYFIPNSVKVIGSSAFYCCTSLTSVEIPDSVTWIGGRAFEGCSSLKSIDVDENNADYSSADGVLFNKNKTTLEQYPAGKTDKSYSIPDSVTWIRSRAFYRCTPLTSVEIPKSVTSIGDEAFDGCPALTIYGYTDSTAERYANNNAIPFISIDDSTKIQIDNGTAVIVPENSAATLDGKTLKVENGKTDANSAAFTITLRDKDGKEVQPGGKVTVKIPVPAHLNGEKCSVYRREADGTYTELKSTYERGCMVFTTDHFSEYVISVEKLVATKLGDPNNDGKVSTVDAKWVLQAISGSRTLTEEQKAAADVNKDGKITTVDAKWILQAVSGSRDLE